MISLTNIIFLLLVGIFIVEQIIMKHVVLLLSTLFFFSSGNCAFSKDSNPLLKQNQTYNFAKNDWFEKIKVSGLIMGEVISSNHDAGSPRRFPDGGNKNYSTFCFPRASLYIDAKISELTNAHLALNFAPAKMSSSCSACGFGRKNDELRFSKYDKIDESYVTFSNANESPYYARAGIQYMPYGYYARNTIPANLPQLMTQTQAAGVTGGYIDEERGLNLAIFSFSGKNKRGGSTKIDNIGAQIGYIKETEATSSIVTAGWMNNIVSSVNYIVSANPTCCGQEQNPLNKGYRKRVPGVVLTMRHKELSWDATLQLTSALSKFNSSDVAWKSKGARPSAGLLDIGYIFEAFGNRKNRIGASYQLSTQGVNIRGNGLGAGLPKTRVQCDYTIEIESQVEFGAHIFWDKDYSKSVGGTDKSGATLLLTMSVKLG